MQPFSEINQDTLIASQSGKFQKYRSAGENLGPI
jgi:hypothetical protein